MRLDGVITPTRVELGSRCYRRHALSDIAERGLYKSPSAGFGTVIHAGAASHWKGEDVEATVRSEYAKAEAMNEKHSLELALAMMDTYRSDANLAGPFTNDGDWKVVSIEERLPVKYGEFTLNFQLDRLLGQGAKRLLLIDTKSAARLDQKWRSQWDRSLQMKLYKRSVQKLYEQPVDIIMEGLLKTPKSKVEYYLCPDWDEATLDEAERQMTWIASQDKSLLKMGEVLGEDAMVDYMLTKTPFNYQDCYSYNVECPFLKLCNAPPLLRRAILDGEYIDVIGDY